MLLDQEGSEYLPVSVLLLGLVFFEASLRIFSTLTSRDSIADTILF